MSTNGSVVVPPGRALWRAVPFISVAAALTTVGAVCDTIAALFPLHEDDGTGTTTVLAGFAPTVAILVFVSPWLVAGHLPSWRGRRELLFSLAAAQAAGLGAVLAATPPGLVEFVRAVTAPGHDVPVPGQPVAQAVGLWAAVSVCASFAVLASARAGRSPLPVGAALLAAGAIAAGISASAYGLWPYVPEAVMLMPVIVALVGFTLAYFASPVVLLVWLARRWEASSGAVITAFVVAFGVGVPLTVTTLWYGPPVACLAVLLVIGCARAGPTHS
jgi:hypothetical protein